MNERLPIMNDRWRIPVCPPARPRAAQTRLFPLDLALVRRRMTHPDYATLVKAVETQAAQAAEDFPSGAGLSETARAARARAAAFLAVVRRDSRMARLALDRLAEAGSGEWPQWVGMAQAVHDYLLAADLLAAAGHLDGAGEDRLRNALAAKLVEGLAVAQDMPQNNWRIETDCTVASAALFFWHRPGPLDVGELLASSLDGISRMLFGLLAADGANAEGINYSRRGAIPIVRLGWAYRRRTGVDLLNHPVLRRWWQWQIDLKRPDGRVFPIDDSGSGFEGFPHALLVHPSIKDAPIHHWAWVRGTSIRPDWATETLLVFDRRVAPRRPSWPLCRVRRESGTALFRSGWGRDATMGILVARPLPPFGADQINTAHRHDDPTNFLLHARGKLLVTEGGYGGGYGDPDRYGYLLTGLAHNMILVDGSGPLRITSHNNDSRRGNTSQSAGRVMELVRRRGLYGAQAETSYADCDLRRSVFFVRNRWFVLCDEVEATRTRRFEWIMHGNSAAITPCHPGGCVWTMGDTRLWMYQLLPSGLPWHHDAGRHSIAEDEDRTDKGRHDYWRVWTAGRRALFVSVLIPGAAGEKAPRVEVLGQDPVALRVRCAGSAPDVFVWKRGRTGVGSATVKTEKEG